MEEDLANPENPGNPENPENPEKPTKAKRFIPWPDEFGPYHFGSYRNRGISFVLIVHKVPQLTLFFIVRGPEVFRTIEGSTIRFEPFDTPNAPHTGGIYQHLLFEQGSPDTS